MNVKINYLSYNILAINLYLKAFIVEELGTEYAALPKAVVVVNCFLAEPEILLSAPLDLVSSCFHLNIIWIGCILKFGWKVQVYILWDVSQSTVYKRPWDFMEHYEIGLVEVN